MSTKILLPNQHDYLHPFYGIDNCCLCKAEFRIKELEIKVAELEKRVVVECGKTFCKECGVELMGIEKGTCSLCVSSQEHVRDLRW